MQTKELRHGGALESEDVVNPGDWCDGGPFGVAMLGQEMSLNFEEEVVVRLVGYHVGGDHPSL